LHGVGVALQLADDRAGVDVIDARQPHPLGDDAEADAVRLLARVGAVPGAVQVEQHAVLARPLAHRLDGRVADHQVDHDDDAAQLLGKLGALVHLLHRPGGDVEIVPLDLARGRLRTVDAFHAVEEAVAPAHEGLAVDVLVVLGEVQPAAQRLVDDAAVVARRESQLGLGGGA
jgi:hypothetical protein